MYYLACAEHLDRGYVDQAPPIAVVARNYGQAGAVDFFGPRHGLPKAIGKHQNYFPSGPRGYTGECVITVGGREADVRKSFDRIERAAALTHPHVLPHENDLPVFVCRGPKRPLKGVWPDVKCHSC